MSEATERAKTRLVELERRVTAQENKEKARKAARVAPVTYDEALAALETEGRPRDAIRSILEVERRMGPHVAEAQHTWCKSIFSPDTITEDMIERGAVALINADAAEPYDRPDGTWRPAVLAEAIIRAALEEKPYSRDRTK